ncbi:hypothetical protein Ahy_B10g106412 [Arachis hypogaea]|uniref:TF-B3 domain-containing protein n=1 Tax=Arachis hypogaea TaxID=3818 RepID=A0A444XAY2_ARAHY|nr:hypothetical protein Ahy_B10g106412 [Arachis hypogaea]
MKLVKSNLQRSRANFKASFYTKYFENKEQNVEIQYKGKLWPAKLLCYPVAAAAYISNGWRPFSLENDLKVGDVCVFELINGENPVLDAHIYRANG